MFFLTCARGAGAEELEKALAGLHPNQVRGENGTLLTAAARSGKLDMVELLLKRGASADDEDGIIALHAAAAAKRWPVIKRLVKEGADVHAQLGNLTAVQVALPSDAVFSQIRACISIPHYLSCLGDLGLTVNDFKDRNGNTMLMAAAGSTFEDRKVEAVRTLLEAGATVDDENRDGMRALHFAAAQRHWPTIELLVDAGADVKAEAPEGKTAAQILHPVREILDWAGACNNISLYLKRMAKLGVGVNEIKDAQGHTMLMAAAGSTFGERKPGAIRMLLDAGADLNARDYKGRKAVHYLAAAPMPSIEEKIDLLIELGDRGADLLEEPPGEQSVVIQARDELLELLAVLNRDGDVEKADKLKARFGLSSLPRGQPTMPQLPQLPQLPQQGLREPSRGERSALALLELIDEPEQRKKLYWGNGASEELLMAAILAAELPELRIAPEARLRHLYGVTTRSQAVRSPEQIIAVHRERVEAALRYNVAQALQGWTPDGYQRKTGLGRVILGDSWKKKRLATSSERIFFSRLASVFSYKSGLKVEGTVARIQGDPVEKLNFERIR